MEPRCASDQGRPHSVIGTADRYADAAAKPVATAAPRIQPTTPVQAASSVGASAQQPPVTASAPAIATATLLAEADALEKKGQWVTPGQNAAQRYVRVLQTQPESEIARARLDKIVGGVAQDASDMILRQRFDSARRLLDQLAVAVPEMHRSLVSKDARDRWRVVQLVLDADTLMQQYRLEGPDDPNALGLLREALRIDPNNAIADEMLAKVHGLQMEREKQ